LADSIQSGETVVCWRNVKNDAGEYVDPSDSMTISIFDPSNGAEVDNVAMIKDAVGKYHYDYIPLVAHGDFQIYYTATHGTRITKAKDTFRVG